MAGQFRDFFGTYTDANYLVPGVSIGQKRVTHASGGSRTGAINANYVGCILISEDGTSVIKLATNTSTDTCTYTVLKGTDANVGTAFANPNRFQLISDGDTSVGTEWEYYDSGGQDVPSGLGQYDNHVGAYAAATYVGGIRTVTADSHVYLLGGSLEGLISETAHLGAILISEVGNTVVKITNYLSATQYETTLLQGTVADVIANYTNTGTSGSPGPNRFRLIYEDADADSEWTYYNGGGTFPFSSVAFDDSVSTYTSGQYTLGVSTALNRLLYWPDGTRLSSVVSPAFDEVIAISSDGLAILKCSVADADTLIYTRMSGTTQAQVVAGFSNPATHRLVFKDVSPSSEWSYYNAGGAFPFEPPAPTTTARVTRVAVEAVTALTTNPVGRVTRLAVEAVTALTTDPFGRVTRLAVEVVTSTAVISNTADGTTVFKMEGFGNIADDSTDLLANGWSVAGGARSIAGGRFGGNGYAMNGLSQVLAHQAGSLASEPRWGVTYWAKWANIGATSNIYRLDGAVTTTEMVNDHLAHVVVELNPDGSLELFAANVSLGATAAAVIVPGTWHHIEVRSFVDAALGAAHVWVDGVQLLTATGINTIHGVLVANVTTTISAGSSTECIIDDLLLASTSLVPMGLHQIHELLPNSAGTNGAWNGTNADVDDPLGTPDEDATVVSSATVLDKQDHGFQDLAAVGENIIAVDLMSRARISATAPMTLVQYAVSGVTEVPFDPVVLTGTYAWYIGRMNVDPATTAEWTQAAVNALLGGVQPATV